MNNCKTNNSRMNNFNSLSASTSRLLDCAIADDRLHAKFINTLSYMENCGARKIAACEHPTLVKEEVLKHASEEFRHAHHLKKQLSKLGATLNDYSSETILGGAATHCYIERLDLKICRYLKSRGFSTSSIKEIAYLLVTYAIELRAEELYSLYDEKLKKLKSKVVVSSILLEEKGHLQEMIEGIDALENGWTFAAYASKVEGCLCEKWLEAVAYDMV